MLSPYDQNMHIKLAQFYDLLTSQLDDEKFAKHALEPLKDNLNYKIIDKSFFPPKNSSLPTGSTALHLALHKGNKKIFEYLLQLGADFTVKDDNDSTVLHIALENLIKDGLDFSTESQEYSFVHSIVQAHKDSKNASNPCDKNGVSHFHAACIAMDLSTVEFFLNNGISPNDTINLNSPQFPGYTVLHFAIELSHIELTKILLQHGASRLAKNANGLNPLHLVTKNILELHDRVNSGEDVHEKLQQNEAILLELLRVHPEFIVFVDDVGFTLNHAACTSNTIKKLDEQFFDYDQQVNNDSPFCPGYSAMHFAARCDISLMKSLGGNLLLEDENGVTPLDLCLERYSVQDIYEIIVCHPVWKTILLSDGQTALIELVYSLITPTSRIHLFLTKHGNLIVPNDSPLWPGYSALHLAVIFTERPKCKSNYVSFRGKTELKFKPKFELINKCLTEKVDITLPDTRGITPVHLAFRLGKKQSLKLLLDAHKKKVCPIDYDNWSYLHIACAAKNLKLVKDLITNGAEINLQTNKALKWYTKVTQNDYNVTFSEKSTALHIAVAVGDGEITKYLLSRGADLYIKNSDGYTAMHLLMNKNQSSMLNMLANRITKTVDIQECVATDGSTYLHVAAVADQARVIKTLCENGADVNATIKIGPWKGYMPLHLAMEMGKKSAIDCLIDFGADLFIKKPNGMAPIYELLDNIKVREFNDEKLYERTQKEVGLTRLHYQCMARDLQAVRMTWGKGFRNVNTRISDDSPIWKGATPLHALMMKQPEDVDLVRDGIFMSLLIDFGADVTIKNAEGNTPVHLAFKVAWKIKDVEQNLHTYSAKLQSQLLLKAHKNMTINPVNRDGLSHFHVTCFFHEVSIAEEFLKNGADVNAIVKNSCSTPLHLALVHESTRQLSMIDLLLKYGADVRGEDKYGNTPLHLAMKFKVGQRGQLFKRIVQHGAHVMAINSVGKSPFEILLRSKDVTKTEVQEFLKFDSCRTNSFNPYTEEGLLPMIFAVFCPDPNRVKDSDLEFIDYTDESALGRTCLHNAVSIKDPKEIKTNYALLLAILLKCFVDCQDNFGRTALHLAVRFRNYEAVNSLLLGGADVNEEDRDGRSPLAYCSESQSQVDQESEEYNQTVNILSKHVQKMLFCNLYVSPVNESIAETVAIPENTIANELYRMKNFKIGTRGITLADMMSEMKIVMAFPTMIIDNRKAIEELFFKNFRSLSQFSETKPLLVCQFKKTLKVKRRFKSATESLRILMGLSLPDLCSDIVLKFLIYWDVRNLIVAAKGEDGLEP